MLSRRGMGRTVLACLAVMLAAAMVPAAEKAKAKKGRGSKPAAVQSKAAVVQTSLDMIPADAAFYSACLRSREQFEAFLESEAYQALKDMPIAQRGWQRLREMIDNPETPLGKANAVWQSPQVKDVARLLGEMVSDDCFVYGDQSCFDLMGLAQEVNNAQSYGPMVLQATGEAEGRKRGEMSGALALAALAKGVDRINVPKIVFGFKVRDKELAQRQLDSLSALLTVLLLSKEDWSKIIDREKVDGQEFTTLTVEGEQIPWGLLPLDRLREAEQNEGDADKVVERLKSLTVVLAYGLRGDYLLVSLGDSLDGVSALGKGKLLSSVPEMAPLKKLGKQKLTSVGYLSRAAAVSAAFGADDIDNMLATLDQVLENSELSEDQQAAIRSDAQELAAELKRLIPAPAAQTSFAFLTDRGQESYSYHWASTAGGAAEPLSLMKHLGGNPLAAMVARCSMTPADYDTAVRWLVKAVEYFEEYGLPQMKARERERYQAVKEEIWPLLERADKANRDYLIPALGDQFALLLDSSLKTTQWPEGGPEIKEPLPVILPAKVLAIRDADKMQQAYFAYRGIFDDLVTAIRKLDPDAVPADYRIPWPEPTEVAGGHMLAYDLPSELGLDERIRPNMLLTDDVLVVSGTQEQSEKLAGATDFEATGLLAESSKPRTAACSFRWAAIIDAITPWAELIAREAAKKELRGSDDDAEAKQAKADEVVEQTRTVLKVLKSFRVLTAEVYHEPNATVTHTLCEYGDIEP